VILRIFYALFCTIILAQANELELSGSVVSSNEKVITSRSMGFVKAVYVKEGMHVKKNQLLFEIDDSNLKSAKKELELTLQIQQRQLKNLTLNLQRQERLLAQDLVPKYDVEQLLLQHHNAQQSLKITQAKLQEINAQYEYLKLKAPNDALVVKKSIQEGAMAMPGSVALILTDLSALEVHLSLGESYLNDVHVGQSVQVNISALNVKIQSHIEAILPNTTPMSHGFIAKIPLQGLKQSVYPGMYAQVKIKLKNTHE
jgi:RND family efflux transporter MFP subunit